ncbi:leucine-rich repeats and immunoglobulin-like domains protein 1 [Saccostrea cucullata]|uniref:leucine-rich repeats and immunoglobulin-like domains protein 1 n=1 Tax=Saccostrea cuccullata TaxID=36930 RepID=UPI002ED25C74
MKAPIKNVEIQRKTLLSLKNCSILNLREALQPFLFASKKKIYSISVTFNDITIVQEDTFQSLVMLQQLDLCHNKIQNIDERAFTDAWKLRILKLCHNKLKQLKKNLFLSNVELVSLYLENNFFENIPIVSLKVLKNLKLLDLSANNIQFIPSLSALSSIKFLYLSNNKIRTIASNAFDGLQHLSMLLLSGNKINNLPEEMSIQFHLMDLGQIILHDNPLTCSCQNRWLISWQMKRCKLHNNTKECALMCFQNGTSLFMENFDLNNLICGMF